MIFYPPQQQVSSFHLVLAVFILILTVYPYIFSHNNIYKTVTAYSTSDIKLQHSSIRHFDIIETSDIHWSRTIARRDTVKVSSEDGNKYNSNKLDAILLEKSDDYSTQNKLHFSSLGRKFDLILNKPSFLVTSDFNVVTLDAEGKATKVPYYPKDIQTLVGFVDKEKDSKVTVSLNKPDNLLTAHIKIGNEIILVEPSYLHKDGLTFSFSNSSKYIDPNSKLFDTTMVVYKLNDHSAAQTTNGTISQKPLCTGLNMKDYANYTFDDSREATAIPQEVEDVFKIYSKQYKTDKRSKRSIEFLSEHSKDKTRCTLHLVADYLFYKNVGKSDTQTTINYLLALINRVNQIYLQTTWETGEESFSNIGFTVQNITIHQEFTRLSSSDTHYNMQSSQPWSAREFLDNFSRYSPPRHYCLAHLLTYRQFDSPVLGLAYVASSRYGTIGGICSPIQQKGDAIYKHNTGISTSKGINGETLITRQADLVVAHELGHNLGAEHDTSECRPSPSKGGAFLMHPYAVMGFEKNNRFLSNCSRISIGRVIRRKAPTCFVGVVDHVCGNGVVEDDEECDGGDVGHGHSDPCCDSSCRFTPGSQCSDRHSWCCSKCRILTAGISCRQAEVHNCKQESTCDGRLAECPASPSVMDDTVCVGRGLCRSGECVPFCEARELHSCLCNNPDDACKLCCKTTLNSTCVPYDKSAKHLPDGLLCYRGVCEKGRCEQPIQDVVERLWDVIEDINFSTIVKFLRDNIVIVVLLISIPIWCILSRYINEFDRNIKRDVVGAITKGTNKRRRGPVTQSPFLPRLFVGDDISNSNSADDISQSRHLQIEDQEV